MRILVVEDEDLVREIIAEGLRDAGFEVVEAATGEEALSHCEEQAADVLFTDIRLPGQLDGWDIAERCRAANPSLPVIYATGYSFKEMRLVPGSRYFTKPYRTWQIIAAIHELAGP